MRRTLRIVGWSVFSAAVLIAAIDWIGRLDWLRGFMLGHPRIAAFIQTPIAFFICLGLAVLILLAEKRLKEPDIAAWYTNFRTVPDLASVTLRVVAEEEHRVPGWDEHKYDWDLFFEIKLTNRAETQTTVDDLTTTITVGRLWNKTKLNIKRLDDIGNFEKDMYLDRAGQAHGQPVFVERYQPLEDLIGDIRGVPLKQEVMHKGWLHFKILKASRKQIDKLRIDMRIVDSVDRKHQVSIGKRKQSTWDNNFFIGPKV